MKSLGDCGSTAFQKLGGWGRFLPSATLAILVYTIAWVSYNNGKLYWTDEIFSVWVTGKGDLDFREAIRLSDSGRDGMMPLFYIFGNLWAGMGGSWGGSELWMRLPSLFWTVAGFVFLSIAIRRRFGQVGGGVGVAIGLLCTIAAMQEMTWFRSYGALVGLTGMLLSSLVLKSGKGRVFLIYVLNAALVLYHPYGLLYGGAITLAPVLFSFFRGDVRNAIVYASSLVIPVTAVLLKIPHLKHVSRLGGDGGMWPVPNLDGLMYACLPLSQPVLVLFMLMVGGILTAVAAGVGGGGHNRDELRVGEFELGSVFLLLVPLSIWLVSQWSSFFVIRYFAPMVVFAAVGGAFLFSRVAGGAFGRWVEFFLVLVASYIFLQNNVVTGAVRETREKATQFNMGKHDRNIFGDGRGGQHPVIIEDLDIFLPRAFYNQGEPYFFPIRKIDESEANSQIKTLSQNLLLEHAKSHDETSGVVGLDPRMLLDDRRLDELVKKHDTIFFLRNAAKGTGGFVLDELQSQGWVASQIEGSDAFVLRKNGAF
jgi:hypothetical protein